MMSMRIGSWTNWHRDWHRRAAAELLMIAHDGSINAIEDKDDVVQSVVGDLILLRL